MGPLKYYTVYDNKTDEIVASGSAQECADALGIKKSSFYYAWSRQKTGRVIKGKYHILVEPNDQEDIM